MKKIFVFLLMLGLMLSNRITAQESESRARSSYLFNFDWKFKNGKIAEAYTVDLDDSNWQHIDLPHDFQMDQPWRKSGGAARGYKDMGEGWYRKTFRADPNWQGKRVVVDFEGIMLWGEVWFNGKKVKEIDFGYLGAEADITDLVKYDNENVIAVYANTGKKWNSRWYTGGGLFRDVHLVVKDTISIARNGVFVTTPEVSPELATVNVMVEIEGIQKKAFDIEIVSKIFSPDGEQVIETTSLAPKGSNLQTVEVSLSAILLKDPKLWSCEEPNLYHAEIALIRNGKTIDLVTQRFGIRTIEFSPEFGFKLNGKKVILKGAANHSDLGAVGVAAHKRAMERQFKLLKEFGFNHIRTAHNPYSKSFMELADEYGILIVDELCDKWTADRYWPGRKPFEEIWYKIVPEWIKRDRNHPSVILWSLGNELQHRDDLGGFPTNDWGVTTYKILDVLVKRYDSTRRTTVGLHPSRANGIDKNFSSFNTNIVPPELALVTEVASFNYRYNDYQEYLKHAPELIIYQSEATSNELLAPYFGMDLEKMVGIAYWGAVDYWGESHGWPRKGWAYGFFSHALQPYPQAYLIKSGFVDEPLVHVAVEDRPAENMEWNEQTIGTVNVSAHWNREVGKRYNIYTYTNADEVELLVNGKSQGIKKNNRDSIHQRNIIYWNDVPYGEGGQVIAVAKNAGVEVARHVLETTGKAASLKHVVEVEDWYGDGMDLQYIRLYAVDKQGRVVPTFNGELTVDVNGEGQLIALDNGDHSTDMVFSKGNQVKMHNGYALAVLRSSRKVGEVVLTAQSTELNSIELRLKTK